MSRAPSPPEAEEVTVHEFSEGAVWNPGLIPWFNVNLEVWRGEAIAYEVLMVPTVPELKTLMGMQSHFIRVASIEYVTPGIMNETGRWQMETVIELTELVDDSGSSIQKCKVEGKRTYRGFSLEPNDDGRVENLIYPCQAVKNHP